jgi:hypothetical protein
MELTVPLGLLLVNEHLKKKRTKPQKGGDSTKPASMPKSATKPASMPKSV